MIAAFRAPDRAWMKGASLTEVDDVGLGSGKKSGFSGNLKRFHNRPHVYSARQAFASECSGVNLNLKESKQ